VKIIGPVLRAECEYFSRGFVSVRTNGRPFITLKQALARDGSFANPDGSPKKITDQLQDTWTHTHPRFPADGIVVGVNTILRDDPKLNTRFAQKNALQKAIIDPYRIVLDPDLETPVSAQIVTDELAARTIIVIRDDLKSDMKAFAKNDVRIIRVPFDGTSFDFDALFRSSRMTMMVRAASSSVTICAETGVSRSGSRTMR
jgi:diaminohydroxyphosphoribosylaminopyrimidine deaminase/5-amino-6-(5-phosphoribosylamino)uracil reductase